jgi:hypothetical protein
LLQSWGIPRHDSLISRKSYQDQNSEGKLSCSQKYSNLIIEEVPPIRPLNFCKDNNSIIVNAENVNSLTINKEEKNTNLSNYTQTLSNSQPGSNYSQFFEKVSLDEHKAFESFQWKKDSHTDETSDDYYDKYYESSDDTSDWSDSDDIDIKEYLKSMPKRQPLCSKPISYTTRQPKLNPEITGKTPAKYSVIPSKKLSINVSNMSTNKYRPTEKMKYKAFGCVEVDDEPSTPRV